MLNRADMDEPAVVICDKSFESCNVLVTAQAKGFIYLVRVKDQKGGITQGLNLPSSEEFDHMIIRTLTR